jgi:hypothetical protein
MEEKKTEEGKMKLKSMLGRNIVKTRGELYRVAFNFGFQGYLWA